MRIPNSETEQPLRPPPPKRRLITGVVLVCIFVIGLLSLWVHIIENEQENAISSVHTQSRVNRDFPIDFVWSGWNGVSQHYWEYDYFRELFPPPLFVHVNFSTAPGIMLCSGENHVNDILQHAKKGHVKVVIQSGDEYGGKNDNCNECFKTFKAVPFVMRQHAVHFIPNKNVEWWLTKSGNRRSNEYLSGKSAEEKYTNVLQLPTGYMTGMLRSPVDNQQHYASTAYTLWSLSVPTVRRKYKWAFIGTIKRDRSYAVSTFTTWTSAPHFLSNKTVSPWDMGQIYNNTVFVIVGAGWISLDCLRIYESIIAGAIPLVVGTPDQISHLFHFNGDVMPLLMADTWDKMLVICRSMTDEQVRRRMCLFTFL